MCRGFLLALVLFLGLAGAAPGLASTMDCVMNDGFEGELANVPASMLWPTR